MLRARFGLGGLAWQAQGVVGPGEGAVDRHAVRIIGAALFQELLGQRPVAIAHHRIQPHLFEQVALGVTAADGDQLRQDRRQDGLGRLIVAVGVGQQTFRQRQGRLAPGPTGIVGRGAGALADGGHQLGGLGPASPGQAVEVLHGQEGQGGVGAAPGDVVTQVVPAIADVDPVQLQPRQQ